MSTGFLNQNQAMLGTLRPCHLGSVCRELRQRLRQSWIGHFTQIVLGMGVSDSGSDGFRPCDSGSGV